MKKIILDTNFIISCIRNKIDFFEELVEYHILIPKQVLNELKKLNAELALKILERNKKSFLVIDFKKRYVDKGIINYVKKDPKVIVATIDRELKKKLKNPKMVIRNKKKLVIE